MPLCEDCDAIHVCYCFMPIDALINPTTGKHHKITGCDEESYWYGEEITKKNENEYADYIKRIKAGK